jgi:hypothetical protein
LIVLIGTIFSLGFGSITEGAIARVFLTDVMVWLGLFALGVFVELSFDFLCPVVLWPLADEEQDVVFEQPFPLVEIVNVELD